jgi:hypothetical protein
MISVNASMCYLFCFGFLYLILSLVLVLHTFAMFPVTAYLLLVSTHVKVPRWIIVIDHNASVGYIHVHEGDASHVQNPFQLLPINICSFNWRYKNHLYKVISVINCLILVLFSSGSSFFNYHVKNTPSLRPFSDVLLSIVYFHFI